MKVVYVAGPFRGANGWEVEQNVRYAEELGYQVAEAGAFPIIPHTNCRFWNGTLTDQFWLSGTMSAMLKCDAVIFTLNYARSSGAVAEHTTALANNMPIFYRIERLKTWLSEGVNP